MSTTRTRSDSLNLALSSLYYAHGLSFKPKSPIDKKYKSLNLTKSWIPKGKCIAPRCANDPTHTIYYRTKSGFGLESSYYNGEMEFGFICHDCLACANRKLTPNFGRPHHLRGYARLTSNAALYLKLTNGSKIKICKINKLT